MSTTHWSFYLLQEQHIKIRDKWQLRSDKCCYSTYHQYMQALDHCHGEHWQHVHRVLHLPANQPQGMRYKYQTEVLDIFIADKLSTNIFSLSRHERKQNLLMHPIHNLTPLVTSKLKWNTIATLLKRDPAVTMQLLTLKEFTKLTCLKVRCVATSGTLKCQNR